MREVLQIDELTVIEIPDAPRLLVEWSPRWHEFVTSVGPAFARSAPRLAGEAPFGILPYRGLLASLLLESFLLFMFVVMPRQIDRLRPYAAPKMRPYEVIYYSGDELPRTEDLGGAQSGTAGRAGGQEANHRTQTIRVARGSSLAPEVVDAPNLRLPSSSRAVANLLALKTNPAATNYPGPPPSEGLHSSLVAPPLPENVIAPAPNDVVRDHSRSGLVFDSVVAPAPSVTPDKSRRAPALSAAVIPPAPNVQSEHRLVAPALDSRIIAPAPTVSREHSMTAPSLDAKVIAPASPRIAREQARSAPAINNNIIPPAPATDGREVPRTRVQMNNVAVVPPPVSAPERESSRNAKLNMPAPSVIAPPPSADSRDLRRLESGSLGGSASVVPPPPTQTANPSLVSSIIGKLFGTQDVVPPPPTVSSGNSSGTRNAGSGSISSTAANIVPPPPFVSSASGGTVAPTRRALPGAGVVPPPPSVTAPDSNGRTGAGISRSNSLSANVVPPPPSVNSSGSTASSRTGSATGGLASNIVPPPPSMGSGNSGSGRKGSGLGSIGDSGSVLAPPKGPGENRDNSGIVISAKPGSDVGVPGSGVKGSIAMSPSGGDKPGLGSSGAGPSIGHGPGPGSGLTAEGSGAGKTGTGHGSDPNARAGISPTPGPGGAGSAPTGASAAPGVDVRGGSTVVTLPSFGAEGGSEPTLPGRTRVNQQQGPAITIVATSRSGGAFDFYGKLPGDNYTVYVDTSIGTVVMQFAEASPTSHPQAGALTGPQGVRTDLPADLPHARVVIKCRLDASGNLRNLQVLEPGPAAMTAKVVAALPGWKFRPAMRGAQPVEVNAILGFNIDTNDRY